MSIILGTLERLEWDDPVPAPEPVKREQPSTNSERKGSSVRSLITSLLFCMALANLMLWYWSSQVKIAPQPVPATVVSQQQVAMEPVVGQSTAAATKGSPASLQMIVPNRKKIVPVKFAPVKQEPAAKQMAVSEPRTALETPSSDTRSNSTVTPVKPAIPVTPAVDSPDATTRIATSKAVEPAHQPAIEETNLTDIEDTIEQARLALSRGRYQQALGLLDSLESVPETRADFWLLKGSAYLAIGQLDIAETALDTAQSAAPYNAQIGVQRAILKQEKGDHKEALRILEPLADRHQNVPEIFLNLGFSQQALGAERAAQRSFRVFLRLTVGRSLYDQQRRAIQEWLTTVPPP